MVVSASFMTVNVRPFFKLHKDRDRRVVEGDLDVFSNVEKIVDSDEASVTGKVHHANTEVVNPNERTKTTDEGHDCVGRPTLLGKVN